VRLVTEYRSDRQRHVLRSRPGPQLAKRSRRRDSARDAIQQPGINQPAQEVGSSLRRQPQPRPDLGTRELRALVSREIIEKLQRPTLHAPMSHEGLTHSPPPDAEPGG